MLRKKSFRGPSIIFFLTVIALAGANQRPSLARGTDEEIRQAARRVFDDLRNGRYGSLYDGLPSASKSRVSRERFIAGLERTSDFYKLDRLEIGAIRSSGDIAVVDTTLYGRVFKPVESDGKIVAQQYMIRENGTWKVATGDQALIRSFLAANPEFARKFPVRPSRVYVKQDGKWTDVTTLMNAQRRGK